MSKLKHTPGPWAWQEGDRYIRIRDEESEKGGYWNESQKIAETYYVNNSEETISNNLLIAAAPEMLEALIIEAKNQVIRIPAVKNIDEFIKNIGKTKIMQTIEKATGLTIEEVLNEN